MGEETHSICSRDRDPILEEGKIDWRLRLRITTEEAGTLSVFCRES